MSLLSTTLYFPMILDRQFFSPDEIMMGGQAPDMHVVGVHQFKTSVAPCVIIISISDLFHAIDYFIKALERMRHGWTMFSFVSM
jgi:hypothetical protein